MKQFEIKNTPQIFDPLGQVDQISPIIEPPQITRKRPYEYSERLGAIISEKYALQIDYSEISKDLKTFGMDIKTTDPQKYHAHLDTVRLKYSLKAMSVYINEIDNNKTDFAQEACNAFEILSRDYQRLSNKLQKELQDKTKDNLIVLEEGFAKHIECYNYFGFLLQEYMHYVADKAI